MPEIVVLGHLEATFPYILSHLEYIIGELLRNSVQAVIEKHQQGRPRGEEKPPPIEVTVCEAALHVIIRVSDRGGGIPRDVMPYLWSFSKGPQSQKLLENLGQVPRMSATLQELRPISPAQEMRRPHHREDGKHHHHHPDQHHGHGHGHDGGEPHHEGSLSTLTGRPPNLRLGMGLPLSRVYAEYWAGSLELHSLEGYGVDAFLQISKLGNKNEQLTTRASMDAV